MKQYVLGIDFGTLSARALLADVSTGKEVADADFAYPHGVMTENDFPGSDLSLGTALQHPADYLQALPAVIKGVIDKTGINSEQIVGVGIDFTASTVLPVTQDGTPLCFLEEFRQEPHAYVKLWKHQGSQPQADAISRVLQREAPQWLESYGGKVSSGWLFPKVLETLEKAPRVYDSTVRFVEAGDWIVWMLTGIETHNSCMAGYKALWKKGEGYPDNHIWKALDPRLDGIIGTKISTNIRPTGTKAGEVCTAGEKLTGLRVGTAVAESIIDAHAALPSAGIVDGGKLMLIIGTSGVQIIMDKKRFPVPGICGSVTDGIVVGLESYEAAQWCVGDHFSWFVENCVPESYAREGKQQGIDIFDLLNEKAAKRDVGESGILVLDWWNGSRTPYENTDLTGTIIGLTLQTKPEDIYRGIIEACAFGTKTIVDLYEAHGVKVKEVYASGGISAKNPFLMQVYADVLGKPIRVAESRQAAAKGCVVFAAVAGGVYDTLQAAAEVLADKCPVVCLPNMQNHAKYTKLYRHYQTLSEYFASTEKHMMRQLKWFAAEEV